MRILPTRSRLAGIGFAFAAATIVALGVFVLLDLDRQGQVNREVITAQRTKDALYSVRTQIVELRSAARLGARTGEKAAYSNIERRAVELERELEALEQQAAEGAPLSGIGALADSSRMLIVHARSVAGVRSAQGAESATVLVERAEELSTEATNALDLSLAAQTQRVNDRTGAQLELGERLRRFIMGLLVIAGAVGGMLYGAYRRVQVREREAQRRVEYMAHYDSVTGLPNRVLLADRLAQEMARARRASESFAVLLFDLDGFKAVNDTWGHAAGDLVLVQVGERVRRCVRASDTVGRLGGDEFLAILPQTSLEGAVGVAEKLREALREPYTLEGAQCSLTVSVGVSLFPDHGDDPEALQRAADAALYRAKREGKNRTLVAAEPEPRGTRNAA